MTDLAVSYLFHVTIDGHDTGMWTECSGLSAQYDIQEYEEGGQNMYAYKLPGRLKYTNVKLKRPLDENSKVVAQWFSMVHVAAAAARSTAKITVFDLNLDEVTSWQLADVLPVKWSGPSFSTTGTNLATEELEIAHHGFAQVLG
jgi:phage tail-like protein